MWRNMFYYGIAMVVGMPLSVSAAGEYCATVSYLTVPENRVSSVSQKIKVAYTVYPASAGRRSKDAVIVLGGGGPGGAIETSCDDMVNAIGIPEIKTPLGKRLFLLRCKGEKKRTKRDELKEISFGAGRDLVLMDYRGAGCSKPSLDCGELDGQSWSQKPAATRACAKRLLEQKVDLRSYNTTALTKDVEDLRKHLGYESLNLLGTSYGSRLALRYMELYPSRARSAVLVSPYPFGVDVFADRLVATRAILRKLLGDEHTAERRIKALITNERDLATMMENLASNMILNDIEVPVTDIATLVQTPMIKYFGPEVATSLLHEGLYHSVTCAEDMAPLDRVKLNTPTPDKDFLLKMAAEMFRRSIKLHVEICAIWPVPSKNVKFNTGSIIQPVLLVVPEYDLQTAPSWAERLAAALPNAEILSIPGKGHSQGTAHPRVKAFIEHPKKKSQR